MTPTTMPTLCRLASIRSTSIFRISESGGTGELSAAWPASVGAARKAANAQLTRAPPGSTRVRLILVILHFPKFPKRRRGRCRLRADRRRSVRRSTSGDARALSPCWCHSDAALQSVGSYRDRVTSLFRRPAREDLVQWDAKEISLELSGRVRIGVGIESWGYFHLPDYLNSTRHLVRRLFKSAFWNCCVCQAPRQGNYKSLPSRSQRVLSVRWTARQGQEQKPPIPGPPGQARPFA